MDITYLLFLQNFREATNNILTPFMAFMTTFGEPTTIYSLLAITYWCLNKKMGRLMLMSFSLASFVNQCLKVTFTVYRPWIRSPLIEPVLGAKTTATGYSFPSGHTSNASSTYGSIAFFLRNNRILVTILGLLILLIMFSRNYLGVHTPQDVVVSIAVTLPLVFLSDWLGKWVEKGDNRDVFLMITGIALGLALTAYASVKSYPMDYVNCKLLVDPKVMMVDTFYCAGTMSGFWLAWFIDRRFINYQPIFKVAWQRIIVGVCGFSVLVTMLFFLPKTMTKITSDKLVGAFSCTTIVMLFIIVIYPLLVNLVLHKKVYQNRPD